MLSNFNHERWVMCCVSARSQRAIVEECMKWVNQRKAFGKPLHSLAVVRSKLADMISRTESVQNWLENVTYQMCNMVGVDILSSASPPLCQPLTTLEQSYREQASKLAGQIAFLKSYSTRCAQLTAADAVQIFGGRGITQTGMGRFVEHVSIVPMPEHLTRRGSHG